VNVRCRSCWTTVGGWGLRARRRPGAGRPGLARADPGRRVVGIDIDEVAVATTDLVLALWAAGPGRRRQARRIGWQGLLVGTCSWATPCSTSIAPRPTASRSARWSGTPLPPASSARRRRARRRVRRAARSLRSGRPPRYTDGATLFALAAHLDATRRARRPESCRSRSWSPRTAAARRRCWPMPAWSTCGWRTKRCSPRTCVCAPILRRPRSGAPDPGTGSVGRSAGRALTAAAPVAVDRATLRPQPTWAAHRRPARRPVGPAARGRTRARLASATPPPASEISTTAWCRSCVATAAELRRSA
jgi:hypothetical protein